MLVEVGRSEGVQTTVTTSGSFPCVDKTSGSVKCEGWVVRGRVEEIVTVTSFSTGPVDELNNSCIESQSCMSCVGKGGVTVPWPLQLSTLVYCLLLGHHQLMESPLAQRLLTVMAWGCVCVFKPFTVTSTHLLPSLQHKLNCLWYTQVSCSQ